MHTALKFVTLPLLGLLAHCSTPDSSSASLPVLTNPSLERAWGQPTTIQSEKGYTMTYANPDNDREEFTITGSRDLMFTLYYPPNTKGTRIVNGVPKEVSEPQVWKKSQVLGQTVKWYYANFPTTDQGAIFKTLGTELKNSSGQSGQYRIVAEGSKNQMQSWLSGLRFRQ